MANIEKLNTSDMEHKYAPDRRTQEIVKQVTATDDNMKMLVDKVNELIDMVNSLPDHDHMTDSERDRL